MFTFFHKRMKFFFILLLILIAPGFLLYGVWSYAVKRSKVKVYAKVWGRKITDNEFQQNKLAIQVYFFLIYGQQYERIAKYADFNNLAWQRILLAIVAEKYGITATADEVREFIEKIPVFKNAKGEFDLYKYDSIITQRLSLSLYQFESMMKQFVINEKLLKTVKNSVIVFDTDIKEYFKENNEEVKIRYINFNSNDFISDVKVDDSVLENYLEKNRTNFYVPDKIKAKYVLLDYKDVLKDVKISEKEIKDYYERNKDLFKIEKKETEQKEADKTEQKDKKPEYKKFEDVKDKIREFLANEKARDLAYEKVKELYFSMESNNFENVSKKNGLKVKETPLFSKNDIVPEIGLSPGMFSSKEIYNELFDSNVGDILPPFKTSKGVILFKVVKKEKAHFPRRISEIKDEVKNAYIREKSQELALKKAKDILEKLKNKKTDIDFENAIKELKLEMKETEYFKRIDSYVPGLAISRELMDYAFSLPVGKISPVIKIPGGAVIFKVVDKKEPDYAKLEKERDMIEKMVLNYKTSRVMQEWIENLRKEANLSILSAIPK